MGMAKEFCLPDIGEGIAEAEIVKWLVQEGASVTEDQNLVEIETDKAIVTLPSPHAGTVIKLHGKEGDIIKVGQVLVSFGDGIESSPPPPEKKDPGSVVGTIGEQEEFVAPSQPAKTILATPAVRHRARELRVDLAKLQGSGPGGRITREDVERAVEKQAVKGTPEPDAYGAVDRVPLRGLRRTIAKRMQEARQRVPDVTIWEDADITDLDGVRLKQRKGAAE